jgi:ribosomal protein S18 acetylase RimI-like enzyme
MIGTALTVAALREARSRGLRVATLQAPTVSRADGITSLTLTDDGAGLDVYRRIGFHQVGEYRHFRFS